MTRLKRLRLLIFVVGVIWVFGMPFVASSFEGSQLVKVLSFGGWLFLAVCCLIYMYGFTHWKDK